jgi:hypothetical protein
MSDLPPTPPDPGETSTARPEPAESLLPLLLADQEERWRRGERVPAESYLARWPALGADEEMALDLIYQEVLLREEAGEAPAVAEYQGRFPQWAEPLQLLFEVHRAIPPTAGPAAGGQARCAVTVVQGPHRGSRLEVDRPDTVVVGRGWRVQLRLDHDPHISRHHFRLEVDPPHCRLHDLGSHNGTFVNGRRVSDCPLHDGDLIVAGQTQLRFSVQAEAEGPARPSEHLPPAPSPPAPGKGQD